MVNLQVTFNSRALKGWLNRLERKQIPFALALSLTNTGKDVQQAVRKKIDKEFILRNRRTEKGIQMVPAKKKNPVAMVGTLDWYMAIHEEGGIRRPRGEHFAVPAAIRQNVRQRITPSKRPRRLLEKKGRRAAFVGRTRHGHKAIFQRSTKKRYPLKILYVFSRKATMKKRPFLVRTAEVVARRRLEANFHAAMRHALATAR